ncbi:MAG: RNB domain-containing ribonuclease [Planctomycetota bacterium]
MDERQIVAIRYRKGLRIGAVDGTSKGKIKVQIEKNRSVVVPGKNVLLAVDRRAATYGELNAFSRELHAIHSGVDLQGTWELVVEDGETLGFREIAELAFSGEPSPTQVAAILVLLNSEDSKYFELTGEKYAPVSPETLAKQEQKAERQRLEAEEDEAFVEWLCGKRELSLDEMTSRQSNWFDWVRGYILEGDEAAQSGRLKSFLTERIPGLGGNPQRQLFDLFVERGVFSKDEHLALLRAEVPTGFRDEAVAEADAYQPEIPSGSVVDVFSIDDETTDDIDDALSLAAIDGGYRVGIHITDLSSAIPPGSALDATAAERVTTHYFPEGKIPMLPRAISEESGSLGADRTRPVLSLFLDLDENYQVTARELRRSVVINRARLTYDDVDDVLGDRAAPGTTANALAAELRTLYEFALTCKDARMAAGAIDIDRSDLLVRVNSDGDHIDVFLRKRDSMAQTLVSELMILYNCEAGRYLHENSLPAIYRTQNAPPPDPIADDKSVPAALRRFQVFRGFPAPDLELEPNRHAMLGVDSYCQITSPLRRYMDLLHQRQLATHLSENRAAHSKEEISRALHMTEERLREFRHLEVDRRRYWLYTHLKRTKRTEFEGVLLEVGEGRGQVEIEEFALRAPASLHSSVEPGATLQLKLTQVRPWDLTIRFAQR